jgi:hypothetical protein
VGQWDDGVAEQRRELKLTGVVVRLFWCKGVQLGGLVSFRGSRWCSRSTESGMESGGGGCQQRGDRRQKVDAAVIQWGRSRSKRAMAVRVGICSGSEFLGMLWNLGIGAASTSCCWQSAAHRGGLAAIGQRRGGVARSEENQRGGARAVAGLETT